MIELNRAISMNRREVTTRSMRVMERERGVTVQPDQPRQIEKARLRMRIEREAQAKRTYQTEQVRE